MWEFIILAILQGLFEWLPISSSGQVLILSMVFLGITPEEAFSLSIWLHIGTMFAVLLKFRKDYYKIIKSFLPKKFQRENNDIKIRNWLIIATLGTTITALPLYFIFEFFIIEGFTAAQGDILTLIISTLLVVTGIILLLSRRKYGLKTIENINGTKLSRDSFVVGIIQGLAILPGISRSAMTVSTSLFEGYEQESALKLSFLISVPVVIASVVVDIFFGEGSVFGILEPIVVVLVTIISFVVGYCSIGILLQISKKIQFGYFCILYGIIAWLIVFPFSILNL